MGKRLWGSMATFNMPARVISLAFVIVCIASMSFTQLGFWSIGAVGGKLVYLMLLLAPLVMGAMVFGPFTGAALGLFAGAVVFAHAQFLPLDFYEVYFMTPLNTFGLLAFIGALSGWLFGLARRGTQERAVPLRWLIVISFGVSLVASVLVQVNTIITYGGLEYFDLLNKFLLCSVEGIVVQVIIDAALIVVLCVVVNRVIAILASTESERKLLTVFRGWMINVSLIVFLATSAIIFSAATVAAQMSAQQSMKSEITYLEKQLRTFGLDDCAKLLDGYQLSIDGLLAITDEQGIILASDDEQGFPAGDELIVLLGYGDTNDDGQGFSQFAGVADSDELTILQTPDKDGVVTMGISFMLAGSCDGGYIFMVQSSEKVYENRVGVMVSSTVLAIALILAMGFVASRLLNRVVVRRIDETNNSLEKITDGDLNERVRVRDSREFASLSSGINTTVDALKDSIAEAEQRNAQELATAKAIQESALPTDFPAFPDIDRFDLYASMKTAKEVGGDFYDFFNIENANKVGLVMADVAGKGIPAALFMMTAKTQIRTYMESGLPIDEAVNAANHQLCLSNDAGMFVTMLACVLDYETGELSYVNAGHNPPLIMHEGTWDWMREVSGLPLGLFDGLPYERFDRVLIEGDMLYTYTDGVTEAIGISGAFFGEERLIETLSSYTGFNPRSVCVGVRRAITDFTLDCEQSDDITMLGLKYGVPPEEKAVMVLEARTDQLVHVYNYIHAELHRRRAPKSVYNPLDIAAEELFVNVCHYAYPNATPESPGEVRISFEYDGNPPSLTVSISDDGIPYNPLEKPDAVTPDDIDDVPIGGLGILMAKRSVDEMSYERVGESNVLTFKKIW